LWRVRPHAQQMYGWERCYDRCKDIVLPAWRQPDFIASSPHLLPARTPRRTRTLLFYFNGALGLTAQFVNYSFGLRQQLHALARGREAEGIIVTDQKTPRYREYLATATFCGVLPGWGWSGRMEDALLHGCIPVILQDGVDAPWETVLDWRAYSLRVPRERMGGLFDELKALPTERVAALQAGVRDVWPRFTYLSTFAAERARRAATVGTAPPTAALEELARSDAVTTLLHELNRRRGERRGRERQPHSSMGQAPTEGCTVSADGAQRSPSGGSGGDVYEGRQVGLTGWFI